MPQNLLNNAQKSLPQNASKELKDFLNDFFARVPADDILEITPEAAAKIAQSHLKMSKARKSGDPIIKIRLAKKEEGWATGRTIIDIVQNDMAFIIDSVVAEVVRHKHNIRVLLHPIFEIERDKSGKTKSHKRLNGKARHLQSHIHMELQGSLTPAQIEELQMGLQSVLQDVDFATKDWPALRDKLRDAQRALSSAPNDFSDVIIEEYQAFLEYLHDNNFTLLGFREYKFNSKDGKLSSQIVKKSGLGLLRNDIKPVYVNEARKGLTPQQQEMRKNLEPLTVTKVNKRSTVHRRVPLDAIAVKTYDKKGAVIGEMLFIGLFTSVTYSRSITDIPLLRYKAQGILLRSKFMPQTHDFKALKHILEKYPRDELFQIKEEDLYDHAISILRLQERPRIALYMRPDPFGRYISALVYVPRERYETRLRLKFMNILEESLGGRCTNFKVTQDDSPLSRVIFFVDINHLPKTPSYDCETIENKMVEAGQLWRERLRLAMEEKGLEEDHIADMIHKYGMSFPINYHERYTLDHAIDDIAKIEEAIETGSVSLNLHPSRKHGERTFRLKIYSLGQPVTLSDILPVLENMGLKVISEAPFEIQPAKERTPVWIHDFRAEIEPHIKSVKLEDVKEVFEEALLKIHSGELENGNLNKLVISAQMHYRKVMVIRTYVRYMRQMRYPFSIKYIGQAVTANPKISSILMQLFDTKFNPALKKDREKALKAIKKTLSAEMRKVDLLDHDRILRTISMLMDASLRTNFYQKDENGNPKAYLSIKLNSSLIKELPEPKPYREIWVYSPRVEGVHLRGDVIARGGLRWSDRQEDFRTEVLGLMKAQTVKNSVIVPMGAKGGFVVKNPPLEGGRDAYKEEGIACYKTFIRGLLDITDNRKGKDVIRPKDVVCYDDEDPYLVVAADKGTATFSDIANAISLEYGHWLGDAFASGGSAGYDHKVMGITAKGAWESVKRHFRELNHNTQEQPFDVIGVGDMSGDVFGNGMLLSPYIRLIGAFNHLHIFCDPNPDMDGSFKERERLFKDVKGWDQYNRKLLSKGGAIFERSAKSLKLTPEIQKAFDLTEKEVSPNELIRAMLRARTDLLWFGGIGTYIKSIEETHADVGDKSNDSLRIDAPELRAKVIGEGANLAVTQAGRIEFAKKGGRINADFIDNSGGVDSSDHEVNIKILLGDVMRKTKHNMDEKARNKLLGKMTEDVASHVLRHNYQQTQCISLIEYNNAEKLAEHAELIKDMERKIGLDRKLENLPSEESIENRLRAGKGLTRPEIATLVSYAKIMCTQDLMKTDIPDTKAVQAWVMKYFPKPLPDMFPDEIMQHRLRREINATMLTSGMINRMGPTFMQSLSEKCGCSSAEVAKAYIIVRESFGLRHLWKEIESLDNKVPAQVQLRAFSDIQKMTERAISWFLTRLGRDLDIDKDIAAFSEGIESVKQYLSKAVTPTHKNNIDNMVKRGLSDGLSQNLAYAIALMPVLASACDIIRIADNLKIDIKLTASTYFEIGEHFHMDWMRTQAGYLPSDNSWASEALDGLIDQLYGCQAGLTLRVLKDTQCKKPANSAKKSMVKIWLEKHGAQADALEPLFQDLRAAANIDLPMLVIAEQRLRALYGG